MADAKPRTALRIENLAAALEQPLEDEASILDALVGGMTRGQTHDALWAQLHAAAQRDDRLAELAFAYERLSRDKKLKGLPPAAQAVVLAHAGAFSAEIMGDADGAEGFLERALALAPGDRLAFDQYERILRDRKDLRRLGELYASAAPQRGDRAEQLALLRRGAEAVAGDPERALKLHTEILRLEPSDATSRAALADLYEKTGRLADLAKLLEQVAGETATTDAPRSLAARSRLLSLYAGALGEIERALPHVEELLRADPLHEEARRVGEELLGHKGITARAAAALGAAYEAAEEPAEAARLIAIEIDVLRGPKRLEAQKRLARMTLEQLGDLDKTFPMYEAIVPLDPSDDEVRGRFVQLASALDKQLEATRTLARAATGTRDAAVRARINTDLGDLFRELGDGKKARASYQAVLDARADEDASLRAARAMASLSREPRDPKALAAALGRLAEIEPTEAGRVEAIAELAQVAEEDLADPAAAIAAYQRLAGGPRDRDANTALARLYEATGKVPELIGVLDRLVTDETDPARARDLAFRAADLRSSRPEGRPAALAAWQAFIATHGASREALARLALLLEHERRWDELATTLASAAELGDLAGGADRSERASLHARLANVLWTRKGDAAAALKSFAAALSADPQERQSRAAVEKMLATSELGLAPADLLEPIVRADDSTAVLVRVLEARAALEATPARRLAALAEASELVHEKLRDDKRAVELAACGLTEAVETSSGIAAWIDRVDRMTGRADTERRAEILAAALGDRAIVGAELAALARRAGEALVQSGDVTRALAIYRRALAAEPSSPELLERVDTLLREQGSPEDRLALYRSAFAEAREPERRRELRHAIGAIQRRDLADRDAALATYREALAETPSDRVALAAVLEIYEAKGDHEELYTELERAHARASTSAERSGLLLRLAELAASRGWLDRAAASYSALIAAEDAPSDKLLAAADAAARANKDVPLLRAVMERRVASAIEPAEEAGWLATLAALLRDEVGDSAGAASALRRAAGSAELAGDAIAATSYLEQLLALEPSDRTAAALLLQLYRDAGAWARMPDVYGLLLRASPSAMEAARVLLDFEPIAGKAGVGGRFVAEADALIARFSGAADPLPEASSRALHAARARVLAADPARFDEAVRAYKALLEGGADPFGPEAAELEALLRGKGAEGVATRRWLLAHRADRAADTDRASALLAWAREEEEELGDRLGAIAVYERLLAVESDHDGALAALARLHLAEGRHAAAAEALDRRRVMARGRARTALDVELAALLIDPLGRSDEALDILASVLEAAPQERAAIDLVRRALTGPARARAADLLEHASDASEDVEAGTALLDTLLATSSSDEELRHRRHAWFTKYLARPGIQPARALEVALAAAGEAPLDFSLWDRAEQLARASRAPDAVGAAYREALGREDALEGASSETIEELGRRAVEFHEEWFEREAEVVVLLQRCLALAPSSAWAFERLKLIFNLGERWPDLFALYDAAIAASKDPDARRELIEDAALAAKDLASDAARATQYYEALYAIAPDARVRTALQRLYERAGKHRALIDLLEADLEGLTSSPGSDPELVQRTRTRIAQLWLEGVGDPDAALTAIERLVPSGAAREGSLGGEDGFAFLERFLARTADDAGARGARRRAASLLRERYRLAGRAGDLARMLRIELDGASDHASRASLLREIAELAREELHDDDMAFDAVSGLLALEPDEGAHREELARLSSRLGRPARLAEALVAAAEGSEGKGRLDLLSEAAEVYEARLGDVERAVGVHRRILDATRAAPADRKHERAAALAAARKLHALLQPSSDVVARLDLLGDLAALTPDVEERRAAHRELAALAEQHGDIERAIAALRAELVADTRAAVDPELEGHLERLLEAAGRWRELVSLLEVRASRAASAGDDRGARADRARVARLYEDPIGDVAAAIDAWSRLRDVFGADEESTEALARLLDREGRLDALIDLLQAEATAATDARAADLWSRVGDLHRQRAARPEEAAIAYELALEQRPNDPHARRGLEALLASLDGARAVDATDAKPATPDDSVARAFRGVVATLTRLYRASEDRTALASIAEPRLATAESDEERASVLAETATLQEAAGDPRAALSTLLRALAITPSERLVRETARVAEIADGWEAIGAALDRGLVERTDLPRDLLSDLSDRVARGQRDRGDLAGAEATLTRALVLDGSDVPLLTALVDVRRVAPGKSLSAALLRLSKARGDDLELFREAADVAESASGDPVFARRLAEELFEVSSTRFGEEGAPPIAAWAVEARVRLAESPADRSEWLLRGAKLPFAAPERRRLRAAAAALAEGSAQVALYEELFEELPGDAETAAKLEQLYRGAGRTDALITLRERQIVASAESSERATLRLDLAALHVGRNEKSQAIEILRSSLHDGFDEPTAELLSDLLEASGGEAELGALVTLSEERAVAAQGAGDRDRAATLFAKAATIAESRLGDPASAITNHRRASALGAATSDEALARLLEARGDHAGAAAVLERICDRLEAQGGAPFAEALLRLVDALRGAGKVSAASARLERAARSERAGGPLRQRLAAVLREAGAWKALADHLADEAGKTSDPAARIALLREAADLHLSRRQDAEAAIPLLEQAAELIGDDPLSAAVHLELAAARRAIGDLESAAQALRSLLAAYGARRPKERARVHYELAQVDLANGERARAIGELDAALRIDPGHADALHALAKLSLEEGQIDRAARTYRALLLVVKRPVAGGTASPGEISRAEILFELAEIARLRGETSRSAEHLESAFEAARESEGEQERLVAVLRARGRHDLLVRALEKRLSEGPSTAEATAIQDELAQLYEQLGRVAEALEARLASLASAVATGERDPAALEPVRDLARRAGQVERYVAAVARFAENERDEARAIRHHVALGEALEEDLKDDARAASAYRKAESLASSALVPDAQILAYLWRALARVYGRLGDVDAEEALLDRMVTSGAGVMAEPELAAALYQLAELRLRRHGSVSQALDLLDRGLAVAPDWARAASLLRAARERGEGSTEVARAFEHVARSSEDPRLLVEALVVLAEAESDPLAAVEQLREAVEVAGRLEDPALGEGLLRRAIELTDRVGDGPLAWALSDLADRRQAAGGLAEAADLRERAGHVDDPERARELLLDVARLAAGPLGDLARAARLYEEMRGREPSDRSIWEPLLEVHRRAGDLARLAALLEETAPLVEDVAERGKLRVERARLAVEGGAPGFDKAIDVLRDVLEDDPSDASSAVMLADLFEKLGRREELAGLVRAQLDAAKDREDRPAIVRLALRLGALLEQQWDEQGALDVYHGGLEWEPGSAELLRQVVRVGMAREDSIALADALDALLGADEADDAVEIALRLAKIRTEHEDAEGAVAAIEKGFRARPNDARLRAELERRYTELGAFAKVADLAVREAEASPSNVDRVAGLRSAAQLLRDRAGDLRGAADILWRALEADPADGEVLTELVDLFTATSQEARAVDAVSRALAVLPNEARLYRTRASLSEALGRDRDAVADLEEAYRHGRGEHVADLIAALQRATSRPLSVSASEEERASVHHLRLRLAGVLAQAGDIDGARRELTGLVERDAHDRTALHALALLEESQGDWDAATAIFARLVAIEDDSGIVVTALRFAEACERGDRLVDARAALERARAVAPENAEVRQRLRDVYNMAGESVELGALLLDDAARTEDPAARFSILMQAGRLFIGSEGEADRSAQVFDEARALRPDDAEATLLLADAYTIGGRYAEARAVLESVVASQRGRRTRALGAVHRRLARLDLAAGDSASALTALTRAFDNDPQNAHLAMELGTLAVELDEHEPATRAFRAVTLMKVAVAGGPESATPALRALSYYHLGRMAFLQGDRRKARLMIDKAVADDPTLQEARDLLEQLRNV